MSSRITSASRFESSFDSSDSTLSDTSESVRFRCSLVKFDDEQDEEEHDVDERRLCLRFILSFVFECCSFEFNTFVVSFGCSVSNRNRLIDFVCSDQPVKVRMKNEGVRER